MPYIIRQDDISVLPLSVRAQNCLRRADIHTIGTMMDYPADEFINIRNMGVRSVEEILGFIRSLKDGTGDYVLAEAQEQAAAVVPMVQEPAASDDMSTVFLDETGAIVQDIPVKELLLSVRARNSLTRNGYKFASELVGITYGELMNLQNMGVKTAEEVLAYIEKISVQRGTCVTQNEANSSGNDLAAEMHSAYGEGENVWLREIFTVKSQFPEAMGETLIYRLYDSVFVRGTVKAKILQIVEENNNEISKTALEEKLPQHLNNTTILEEILLELEAISAVEMGEVMIYRQYPSVMEFAAHIENDRIREVIQGRIEGKTLQEIGEQYGVTRERVRQLMQKGLRKKPYLREDKYAYLYDHYDFSLEDFVLAYDEPHETYYYLEMISQITRAKRKPLEEILTDTAVAPELRKKAERAIYKRYVSTDGVRVKMTRPDLIKHYIKINCKSLTKFDDFVSEYNLWLDSLGLGDDPSLMIEARTYENILNQCDYVLWNQWRSFRYYNILEQDFEDLLSTLNLEQFEDTEFSTLKLFRDYPLLMEQYDIHDEYELHNLLKKIWVSENESVKFKKMPTIEVGSANTYNQVLTLLLQYAPITAEDLANRYEEEYGVKALTVRGNYLRALDHYFYKGVYSIDYAALPSIQFARMQTVLDRDFYTIQDVKRLYKREFPNSDESLLNPYTLKTLGFHVYPGYSGYIVKNTFSGATDYFHTILTQDDIVDMRAYGTAIRNIATYDSEHRRLRNAYEIIEFSPLQYISIRRLNEAGVTKEHLRAYCDAVAKYYEKGEYFTTTSMRNSGFVHDLDDLGFEEWFYSSILFEDRDNFSAQRIGGTRLFLRGKPNGNLADMLVWLLDKYQKIDFYDLLDMLENQYGIFLPKEKVVEIISDTELYYDAIMETVYIDYDTYFEEI